MSLVSRRAGWRQQPSVSGRAERQQPAGCELLLHERFVLGEIGGYVRLVPDLEQAMKQRLFNIKIIMKLLLILHDTIFNILSKY